MEFGFKIRFGLEWKSLGLGLSKFRKRIGMKLVAWVTEQPLQGMLGKGEGQDREGVAHFATTVVGPGQDTHLVFRHDQELG
jgi:hypothetical protein